MTMPKKENENIKMALSFACKTCIWTIKNQCKMFFAQDYPGTLCKSK